MMFVDTLNRRDLTYASILPGDKSFSAVLFLRLIHVDTSFEQLKQGLKHLNSHVEQQSDQRQSLVRQHFGLFVHCAEGLEWLKEFRKGSTYC